MAEVENVDPGIRITIMGRDYEIDPDDLELGEIEVIESACSQRVDKIDWGRASALRALIFVLRRREDPRFTMEDAARVKMSSLSFPDEEPAPPPEPVRANGAGKSSRRPTTAAKAAQDAS